MGKAIVITSGKGGVGKTTTTANLGTALALLGKRVCLVDLDIGLRNLDVILGLDNRIIYNIVDVAQGTAKLHQALKYHGLPLDSIAPKTIKGEPKPLGVWDFEGVYKRFKTLGAKRYIYDDEKGLHTTIAGLPKIKGVEYLLNISNNDINKVYQNFNNDMTVPKGQAGKLVHYYDDEKKSAVIKDFQGHYTKVTSLSAVHLEPTGFTLSLANQFLDFIRLIGNNELTLQVERNQDRS